jgi:hypothetical protein
MRKQVKVLPYNKLFVGMKLKAVISSGTNIIKDKLYKIKRLDNDPYNMGRVVVDLDHIPNYTFTNRDTSLYYYFEPILCILNERVKVL